MTAQKITPFLWFDSNAEKAMNFYVSIFKNSKVLNVMRYGDAGPGPKGTVMAATFQLEGQEVDALWEKLLEGGREDQCGWLQDKFGLSWQIIPTVLGKLLQDKDPRKSSSVMKAMLSMMKIDSRKLQQAYDQA